ncbi:unnamed protein product [Camellia sinensis]
MLATRLERMMFVSGTCVEMLVTRLERMMRIGHVQQRISWKECLKLVMSLKRKFTMSWIYSLSKCDFVEALLLKAVMVSNDMKPNLVTYNALIGCLCRLSRSVKGESLMREMVEFGVNPNIATCKALINGFCKERNLDKAESLLGSIVEEFEIYDVGSDFESAALILGRDENSMEFNLSKMKITYAGVELIDSKSGDLRWCLDFRDMDSPAIIFLSDAYGKKNVEHGGFALCPLYGRNLNLSKPLQGLQTVLLYQIWYTKTAKSMVGLSLSVDISQSLTVAEYMKRRAKEAVRAKETPCRAWSVTRLRSAAHGTLNILGLSLEVGPKGGLGEQGDAIYRQLILTRVSLVERRLDNYEVLEAMICEPHGETTQYTVFVELLRQVASLWRRLFALFGYPAESVRETVAVIMRTIAEEDAIAAESMRDMLLCVVVPCCGIYSYQPALDLLSGVLPPGLVAYLRTRSDGVPPKDAQNMSSQGSSLSRRHRRLLQQRKGRAGKGITSQGPPMPSVNNFEVDPGWQTSPGAFKGLDSYQKSAVDPISVQVPATNSYAVHTGDNLPSEFSSTGAPQIDYSAAVASPDVPSMNTNEPVESNASDSVDSDPNVVGFQNTGIPTPAQIVVSTPVGSGRLLCNWPNFWRAFSLDHNRADLIWNDGTRKELRQALQAEVHNLDVKKERTEDIVPGGSTVEIMTGQECSSDIVELL